MRAWPWDILRLFLAAGIAASIGVPDPGDGEACRRVLETSLQTGPTGTDRADQCEAFVPPHCDCRPGRSRIPGPGPVIIAAASYAVVFRVIEGRLR